MRNSMRRLICAIGILASIGLGLMSIPSRFMATPAEAKAYEIMQEGLKEGSELGSEQGDVVLLSHYAHWHSQERVMKSRVMLISSAGFFVLFLLLLVLDSKRRKPTAD